MTFQEKLFIAVLFLPFVAFPLAISF